MVLVLSLLVPFVCYCASSALLARSRADADRVVVPLANLLSLPPSDRYRMPELSPQKRKEMTLAAFLAQLNGLAARAASVRHC